MSPRCGDRRAIPLAGNMHVFQPTAAADFSVSNNGVLVYQPLRKASRVVWLDRSGRELEQVGPDNLSVLYVRASPDGRKSGRSRAQSGKRRRRNLGVRHTIEGESRPGPGPGIADKPVWSPDGTRLLYARALGSGPKLYIRGLAEQDREEALPSADFQLPTDWSRNGRFALFQSENVIDGDIGVVELKTRKLTWMLASPAHESSPVFSPDGNRMAFVSNESGRLEAYVQAFEAGETPRLTGERLRISTDGAQLSAGEAMAKRSAISAPTASSIRFRSRPVHNSGPARRLHYSGFRSHRERYCRPHSGSMFQRTEAASCFRPCESR